MQVVHTGYTSAPTIELTWALLRRETLDLIRIHYMRRADKALADMQVVKEQAIGHSLPISLGC